MKCAPLSADSPNRIPLLATMPTGCPCRAGEARDERGAVAGLELLEPAAVDEPGDHLADVVRGAGVGGHDVVDALPGVRRRLGRGNVPRPGRPGAEARDDGAHDRQGVLVVLGEVVGDTGDPAVQLTAAQLLGAHDLTGGGLHQWWACQEDRALVAHDHGLVAHGGHVGATGGAGPEHGGDLRDPAGAHRRLVVEDPAEVLAVREHLVLHGQECAAGVDEVDARQAVAQRDLLRPQVLLDRHRVVRAALDRCVVRHHDALASGDPTDPGDDPRAR